ncbi:MAG: hypothetical protein WCK77_20395 [Verrucomicrobiota bacterium]
MRNAGSPALEPVVRNSALDAAINSDTIAITDNNSTNEKPRRPAGALGQSAREPHSKV